jgi:hypothetical protein
VFLRLLWTGVELRVLVNRALVFEWCNDGGGIGDPVDRRRRLTLSGMSLVRGLIVDLMVEGERGSSVRKVFWNPQILLADVPDISLCSSEEGAHGFTCSSWSATFHLPTLVIGLSLSLSSLSRLEASSLEIKLQLNQS